MALYANLGAGSEPPWQIVNIAFDATATPIGTAGTTLWTPPFPCLVRALTCNGDSGAPMTNNGGSTTLSIGTNAVVNTFVAATTTATYNTALQGWGLGGPLNSTQVGTEEAGTVLAAAGQIPGAAAVFRVLQGFSNAGTITGTLRIRFEMRPFAGSWA